VEDFKDKVAFITGGASGVGLGQAKVLSGLGTKVVLADIRQDHLDQALGWFRDRNRPAHGIRLDITDRAAFARAADETERVFGVVQLLFNTAGVSVFGPLEKSTYEDYDWMMGVNFGGVVNGIQTFVPRMIGYGKGGHVVNTASLGAFTSNEPAGIYCASKFAVRGLTEALRGALAKYGIGVSFCAGIARSPSIRGVPRGPTRATHASHPVCAPRTSTPTLRRRRSRARRPSATVDTSSMMRS
jgi:NAD(P)-dependent dehydrogenase (short-subunit alcohol dehydrogenase family)